MMMRMLVVLDDSTTESLGTEIVPAKTVSTLSNRTNLAWHVGGRFYDIVLVHQRAALEPQHYALLERCLSATGIILPITAV